MLKKAFYISLLFCLLGCGGTFRNFRAYYNTYYNAQKNFKAGLDKVRKQEVEIDVTEPLRVHPPPVLAGEQDFQKAIDKGARILNKFPNTKWVDETLGLIGKSYYYRQEFYSALQKFEEQYSVTDDAMQRQQSVIWKGRILLDLELYDQGVVFLRDELSKPEIEWRKDLKGETEVVLAEHYVQLQNWQKVDSLLQKALPELEKSPMRARAFFLYGQILETEQRYGEASYAFSRAANNRPGFELLYWANLKQAGALRKMGNLQSALAIYEKMRKDDKNVDRLAEIDYEIARTEEENGDIQRAEKIYKSILRNEKYTVPQQVQVNTYYRLGQIYSQHFDEYELAAAYYDSSSSFSRGQQSGIFAEELDTETLAEAYGRYSRLKNQIADLDSLIWLGSLPEQQFDSVIAVARNQRIRELSIRNEELATVSGGLANIDRSETGEPALGASGVYGFLNYRNSRLLAEAKQRFRAVWGDRALVDNWRRVEAIRGRDAQGNTSGQISRSVDPGTTEQSNAARLQIDISEVPFTEEERSEKRDQIAIAKYELGNLFLLTLEQADSAAHYFKSVVGDHEGHDLVPNALYSLFEIYFSKGDEGEAQKWANRLLRDFPDSIYTRELNERLGNGNDISETDSTEQGSGNLPASMVAILDSSKTASGAARELRELALANSGDPAAALVHYEAIKQYIKIARMYDSMDTTIVVWNPVDYQGIYWDSVRAVVKEHRENFSVGTVSEKVEKLSEELESATSRQNSIPSCTDLGITPGIKPNMEGFLEKVRIARAVEDTVVSDLEYEIVISDSGAVETFELLNGEGVSKEILEAYNEAVMTDLEFFPLQLPDSVAGVRCNISFPLKQ